MKREITGAPAKLTQRYAQGSWLLTGRTELCSIHSSSESSSARVQVCGVSRIFSSR